MWYDINETLSHNCLLNFVVGQRGVGKTYACKRKVIKNFLKRNEQFIYLRRYETEIKAGQLDKFFSDIEQEFPNTEFNVRNSEFYIDGHVGGYALPLSKASQFKSVPFPNVSFIIFDEFIIDQGMIRYLPNEVVTFNEMYSTIARLRDVVVMFLSNAITFTNPYFIFFDLKLQQGQRIYKKNDILLQMVSNDEYAEKASQTRFGKIIAGTKYGDYAIKNQFLKDNDYFIEKLPGPGKALFTIIIQEKEFTVYSVIGKNNWYASHKVDPGCKRKISMEKDEHNDSTILKGESSAILWINELKQKYYSGQLRFTSIHAKNLISKFL